MGRTHQNIYNLILQQEYADEPGKQARTDPVDGPNQQPHPGLLYPPPDR